jgi:hypothetical protein
MKQILGIIVLLLFISILAMAQTSTPKQPIDHLVYFLSEAYSAKKLSDLDGDKPFLGNITVVIQHSLRKKVETKSFNTLGKVDEWLKSREKEDLPSRETSTIKQCKKGVCTFDWDSGILHNQLYLNKITFTFSNGRFYITAIHLLDGD